MKLATTIKFRPGHAGIDMEHVLEAERLGFDAVWAGEAYGTDAVSPVAWVLARTERIKAGTSILQMPARTPACAAMTAIAGPARCAKTWPSVCSPCTTRIARMNGAGSRRV